eukprot:TRINITY_DN5238_c0_g2_i1.p1 TRINITY_DN5238_c0_g2~~TRINITY_DN5238_c0_g2_i1.p1  ORF type:complete len:243 (+),score=18.47 TRINITY_DN5238_c0_g2_i1:44-772(+)
MEDTQETKVDIVESVVHPTLEFIEPSLAHIEDEKNVSQLPLPSILDPNKPLSSNSFAWIFDVKEEEESNASLLEELDINPNEIFYKIRCILFPFYLPSSPTDDNVALLRTPDFWGPLLTVLVYCFILFIQHPSSFSWILSIWLFGSFILFCLNRVLGGESSYSVTLGLVGYSLIPLIIAELVDMVIPFYFLAQVFKWIGCTWAVFGVCRVLGMELQGERRFMMAYPVVLLFVYFVSLQSGDV